MRLPPRSISAINALPYEEKLPFFRQLVPPLIFERYQINREDFSDQAGNILLKAIGSPGSNTLELSLFHQNNFSDPVVYFHLTDTISQQIHVLLAVINDPDSPRFDVDRLPSGEKTHFGIFERNLEAELGAFNAGLSPGQVRRGLRLLPTFIACFEDFVRTLGHDMYFAEPLYYHNAVLFEQAGFAYQQGRRWMQSLNTRFSEGGDLRPRLDGSTPFRQANAWQRIRTRSWAIHDGLLGEPFTGVTMYKRLGINAGVTTFNGHGW